MSLYERVDLPNVFRNFIFLRFDRLSVAEVLLRMPYFVAPLMAFHLRST